MVRVEIDSMKREFADGTRVGPINLSIEDGEVLCLLGPSGSGKTTTLRMVAGFIRPQAGRLRFDGLDVTELPARERGIGMVFQSVALFPNMDVFQNIAFGPTVAGWKQDRIVDRVLELSDLLEIRPLLRRKAKEISGGEAQRIALARALANEPKLLLLDEPLSSLDPQLREKLQHEIRSVQRKLRTTTIYVTHSQEEAFALADRIAVLNDGVVQQRGTPQELYENPRCEFVARFIGGGNTVAARVVSVDGDGAVLQLGDLRFRARGTAKEGELITFTVKPENVMLSMHQTDGTVGAEVRSITPLAGAYRVVVECEGVRLTSITHDPTLMQRLRKGPDQTLFVRFGPDSTQILRVHTDENGNTTACT